MAPLPSPPSPYPTRFFPLSGLLSDRAPRNTHVRMLELPACSSILENSQAFSIMLASYYTSAAKKLEYAREDSSIVAPHYSEPHWIESPCNECISLTFWGPYNKSCPAIAKFPLYRTQGGRIFAFVTAGCDCTRVAKVLEHARAVPQTINLSFLISIPFTHSSSSPSRKSLSFVYGDLQVVP